MYPQGTARTSNADIDDWVGNEEVTNDEDAGLFRVDHRFSDKTNVFLRYNFDKADIVSPGDTGFTTNYICVRRTSRCSSSTSSARGGQRAEVRLQRLDSATRSGPGRAPSSSASGFTPLTGPQEIIEDGRTYSVLDDLAIVRGRHNIKIGGEIRRIFDRRRRGQHDHA